MDSLTFSTFQFTIFGIVQLSQMIKTVYAMETEKILPSTEMLDLVLMELVANAYKYGNQCNDQLPITVKLFWDTHSTYIQLKDAALTGGLSEDLFSGEIQFDHDQFPEWGEQKSLKFGIPLIRTFAQINFHPSGNVIYKLPHNHTVFKNQEDEYATEPEPK